LRSVITHAKAGVEAEPTDDDDMDAFKSALQSSYDATKIEDDDEDDAKTELTGEPMTGAELRALVEARWGRAYDTRILQRRNKVNQMKLYLQVMWKFLGQKSFPMSERKYMEQLDAVADLLTEWGCADQIRREIPASKTFPKMDTTGANAVSFTLDVEPETK